MFVKSFSSSALVLGLIFFLLTALSIWPLQWSDGLPIFWPAPAVLLAFLATRPTCEHRQAIIYCALGGSAAMLLLGWPWYSSALMVGLAVVEEIFSLRLLRRLRGNKIDWFDNLDGLIAFMLVAGVLAPALFAVPASLLSGAASHQPFTQVWLAWWAGDGLGAMTVTPLLYLFLSGSITQDFFGQKRHDRINLCFILLIVAATGIICFWQNVGPFLFLTFFPVMIAAFKAERLGALLSVLLLTTIGAWATLAGYVPVAGAMGSSIWSITALQIYSATLLLTALPAAVELQRRRKVRRQLRAAVAKLTESEKIARLQANTDALTGLANRRAFCCALERALQGDAHLTLAVLDVDGFKSINDHWGHLIGDQVLKRIARRFSRAIGDRGLLARLGGDEFALLIERDASDHPEEIGRLLTSLDDSLTIGTHELTVGTSCGIVQSCPDEYRSASRLLARADVAMYHAKRSETKSWQIFSPEMEEEEKRKMIILERLGTAKGREEVGLVYQPIVDLHRGAVASVEALARWNCPVLGPVSPTQFIPLAERGKIIRPLTWHLLTTAMRECSTLPPEVALSFNVSANHVSREGFASEVLRLMEKQGFAPERLKLEVTETALLVESEEAARNCRELQKQGIRIILDDFGAGYASVSYLQTMSFDEIKLDGSLILSARRQEGLALAKGVLDLCHALQVPCTAEHLEDRKDVERFKSLGCRFGQGYFLHRPLAIEDALEVCRASLTPRTILAA